MARRLNLFVLYLFKVWKTEEETQCAVCVTQTESKWSNVIVRFLLLSFVTRFYAKFWWGPRTIEF